MVRKALATAVALLLAVTPAAYGNAQSSMVSAINTAREKRGLRAIAPVKPLHRVASQHAADMVTRHYFGHVSPSGVGVKRRILRSGFVTGWYWKGGETLARGYTRPKRTLQAWLASPEHRAIVLAKWVRWVGIARSFTAGGVAYWSADFVRRWR